MKTRFRGVLAAVLAAVLAVSAVPARAAVTERHFDPATLLSLQGGLKVRNETGQTIARYSLVYVSGWSETHQRWLITKADADVAGARAMLVVTTTTGIVTSTNGEASPNTTLLSQNTNGSTIGNPVYLSATAGGITLTAPSASNAIVQIVGRVRSVSSSVGKVEINLRTLGSDIVKFGTNEFQSGAGVESGLAIYNNTGGSIVAGDLVYVSGYNTTGTAFEIAKADADVAGAQAQYIAQGTITNTTAGTVYRSYTLTGLNTDAGSVGDPVYLSTTAAGWTLTPPSGSDDIVQIVGRVSVDHASTGAILFNTTASNLVKIATNEIQAGSVTATEIATSGVATAEILDGTITVDDIATSGVATAEILDATIINGDIADDTIRPTKRDYSYIQDEFRGVAHCELTTGAAATGATGDTDRLITPAGIWEYHIKGAGQTIICPTVAALGLDIALDETNTEGVEITTGIAAARHPNAFVIGTSAAFKSCVTLTVDDASGAAVLLTGFRKAEAYQADENDYADYALIGALGTANPNTIQLSTELNGAAATVTDTTNTWADGASKILCTNVSGAGVVTYTINGSAPSTTAAYTFDTGDTVIPVLYFLHGGDVANTVTLQQWEVGLQ